MCAMTASLMAFKAERLVSIQSMAGSNIHSGSVYQANNTLNVAEMKRVTYYFYYTATTTLINAWEVPDNWVAVSSLNCGSPKQVLCGIQIFTADLLFPNDFNSPPAWRGKPIVTSGPLHDAIANAIANKTENFNANYNVLLKP